MMNSQDINLINQLPGLVGTKDQNSILTSINKKTADILGFQSPEIILENRFSDYDVPSPISELAPSFIQEDKEVIETMKTVKLLNFCHGADGNWRLLFGKKDPLRNQKNEIVGTVFIYLEIEDVNLLNFGLLLKLLDIKKFGTSCQQQFAYILKPTYNNLNLTKRESECVFYFLRGRSAKEIARILNRSPRTIESHFARIKDKLNCKSRSELFDKCLAAGINSIIPDSLIRKNLITFE